MLLSQEQADASLGDQGSCPQCGKNIVRVYCRDCDEFSDRGHATDCIGMNTKHAIHRLQWKEDDVHQLRGY